MRWHGHAGRWGAILAVLVAGGCALFGGQTGEDSANDSGGWGGTGGVPCGSPRPIDVDTISSWGFSGRQMLDAYQGTWVGSAETSSGVVPPGLADTAEGSQYPVSIVITYELGPALEADCDPVLEVEVQVSIDLGDGWLVRSGSTWLYGDLAAASLDVVLAPSGDGSDQEATVMLTLHADGTATGSVTVDDWWGSVTASRSP